jgi:hypothetical protein
MAFCPERDRLSANITLILSKLIGTTQRQLQAVQDRDQSAMLAFDKELEDLMGEKERAFGALNQHTCEHGC